MVTPLHVNTKNHKSHHQYPHPPNFYTSGTSNEQLNIHLYPHQTLFTHNDHIIYLSDKLTVEQLPCIELPKSFNSTPKCFDKLLKCFTNCVLSLCKCSLFGGNNFVAMTHQNSNWMNHRMVINNNHNIALTDTQTTQLPFICLSPSLQTSASHSIGKRNFISPTHDSSSISAPLSRKILSINLSAQKHGCLIINIVNLFAYILNDTDIYSQHNNARNIVHDQLLLDFESPIQSYKLLKCATYTNENSDRLFSSLDRVMSLVTNYRNNNANVDAMDANGQNAADRGVRDWVSRRTSARSRQRKARKRQIAQHQKSNCCLEAIRYLFMLLSLALFPAVFILILMNQVLEQMSFSNFLPLSNTLCLVKMQCPHKRMRTKRNFENDTIIFLESNGDIYHKSIGKNEKFFIRGECVIAFDECMKSVKLCNYGQNGVNLREYRCKGDFIEFIGPGNLWYGNGKQDLLSNCYKLKSLLFCDNLVYSNPNFIPNVNDVRNDNNNNNNIGGMVSRSNGNYSNGRFGIIQSFELKHRYRVRFIEKCLVMSTITLVLLSCLLFMISMHLQPNFLDAVIAEMNDIVQEIFRFP